MEAIFLIFLFISILTLLRWLRGYFIRSSSLPPGPKGYPIIGNLLDVPTQTPWIRFAEWSKVYGDVVYVDLPGQPTIVLNSIKAGFDLLDKRSDIYSDRPVSLTLKLIFWDWAIGFMPYSQKWRNHRREFHQYFNQREVVKFEPIQLKECRAFLRRAIQLPDEIGQHLRLIFTAIILKISYDMDVSSINDEYVRLAQEAVFGVSISTLPGTFWAEYFPFLRYLPEWFPGSSFKKTMDHYRPITQEMRDKPFDKIQQDMAKGKANPSLTTALIERLQRRAGSSKLSPADDELARNVTGIAYAAAADTSTSAAQSFMIAMSLFPDVQRKAQEELDRVVGSDRLPEFGDLGDLLYIQAISLEAMRWMVVLPFAIFHRVICDDEYNGYFIPKGTTVIANAWAMLHDPETYPDPKAFKPERYIKNGRIDASVRDPLTIAFGFGRRICPGRYLAQASLLMTIASTLHTFNIHPILNEKGEKFDPFSSVVSGIISSPEYVPCNMQIRSDNAKKLIEELSF